MCLPDKIIFVMQQPEETYLARGYPHFPRVETFGVVSNERFISTVAFLKNLVTIY